MVTSKNKETEKVQATTSGSHEAFEINSHYWFFDIFAIFEQSVVTITLDISFDFKAVSIVYAINGFPANNLIFLFGNLFDCFFAGIIASILCRNFETSIYLI